MTRLRRAAAVTAARSGAIIPAWPRSAERPPRSRQLTLLLHKVPPPLAQPLLKHGRRMSGGRGPGRLPWVEQIRANGRSAGDDPTVLPPAVRGQLPLFGIRRTLTRAVERRIADRELAGWPQAKLAVTGLARERSLSETWRNRVLAMTRLALAVRDVEGHRQVHEEDLDGLPALKEPVAEALRSAGLLLPRPSRPPMARPKQASCVHCGSWGRDQLCEACRGWSREPELYPRGTCSRCRRPDLPRRKELCRGCRLHIGLSGPDQARTSHTQLWLGAGFRFGLRAEAGRLGYLLPVLTAWGTTVGSLREITATQAKAALEDLRGNRARGLQAALRSLFRALRQERLPPAACPCPRSGPCHPPSRQTGCRACWTRRPGPTAG
ncbi:hypothetical protein [Streptosporangium roseum]|uniref:hypothetical protein n=1 Tax=Streptosporangium roseum TaxID=2001 RepID=UPI00332F10B9